MSETKHTPELSAEIKAWLQSDRDFDYGCMLFLKSSSNRAMAMQFQKKGISMATKLEYELEKILERYPAPVSEKTTIKTTLTQKKNEILKKISPAKLFSRIIPGK